MKNHIVLLSTVCLLMALLAGCVSTGSQPAASPSPSSTPPAAPGIAAASDEVRDGVYYHNGFPVTQGWNGLNWRASLDEFKTRFPQARQTPDGSGWQTGEGPEPFFGFSLPATYFFDTRNQLIAVAFKAADRNQSQPVGQCHDPGAGGSQQPESLVEFRGSLGLRH
jgi:hypothetical protein